MSAQRPARELGLVHQPVAERQQQRERGGCHRSAHTIGRDRDEHAARGAGIEIDRVVADAEARDERQPVGRRQRLGADPGASTSRAS
ncbi:MAG: hypothetical protein U0841_32930 [Chloroflexia bacterium]